MPGVVSGFIVPKTRRTTPPVEKTSPTTTSPCVTDKKSILYTVNISAFFLAIGVLFNQN